MDVLQRMAKALAGGLAGLITAGLFTTVTDPDAVVNPDAPDSASAVFQMPNTTAEWVTTLLAVLLGFGLPYLKRNFPSVAEALSHVRLAEARVDAGKQST